MPQVERIELLEKFVSITFEAGQSIIEQGEMGELFYIVKEGQVDCLLNGKKVRTYNSGEYFGERALRLHEPRAATCVARGAVTCVTLRKDDFETLLGPLQSVLDHNMLKDTLRTAPIFRFLTPAERENVLDGFEYRLDMPSMAARTRHLTAARFSRPHLPIRQVHGLHGGRAAVPAGRRGRVPKDHTHCTALATSALVHSSP